MKLVKCDKCGEIVNPYDSRRIQVALGAGPCNAYGQYEYEGKVIPAAITKELCIPCWLKFSKKMCKYFNVNPEDKNTYWRY